MTQTSLGTDRSRSVSQIGNAELLLNGPLFELPGGSVTAAARAGFDARGLDSETLRGGALTAARALPDPPERPRQRRHPDRQPPPRRC